MKELAEVEVDSAAAAVVVDVGDSVVDAAAVVAAAAVDVVVRATTVASPATYSVTAPSLATSRATSAVTLVTLPVTAQTRAPVAMMMVASATTVVRQATSLVTVLSLGAMTAATSPSATGVELPTTLLATAPMVIVSRTCVATAATTPATSPSTAPLKPERPVPVTCLQHIRVDAWTCTEAVAAPGAARAQTASRLCYAVAVPAGEFLALFCKLIVGDKWTRCLSKIFINVLLWWVVINIHRQNLWHVVVAVAHLALRIIQIGLLSIYAVEALE